MEKRELFKVELFEKEEGITGIDIYFDGTQKEFERMFTSVLQTKERDWFARAMVNALVTDMVEELKSAIRDDKPIVEDDYTKAYKDLESYLKELRIKKQ